jgi:Protein of unknown function (DUF4058)/Protein of unknown function (DUF2934)
MPSPLPGMDPYLEDPHFWPEFHRAFVAILSRVLEPDIQGRYEAAIGTRRYPIVSPGGTEQRQEDYIEIRRRTDHNLATLIDIVSPTNKTTDEGRRAYLAHRGAAQQCKASLVEIDLVLQGQPTLTFSRDGLPHWDHAVTVVRSSEPERYEIYTSTLQKRLPKFRVPLSADDRDFVIDLQAALTRCYDEADFISRIDYKLEPAVPLGDLNRRWLDTLLIGQNLRKPLPSHEETAIVAYRIWEQAGRPQGRQEEHWYLALAQLRGG